jgi:hypothetical protein
VKIVSTLIHLVSGLRILTLIEIGWHLSRKGVALVVSSLKDPMPCDPVSAVRVLEQLIFALTAEVKPVVSEARVALAGGLRFFLLA